jgi:hypothetical protein
MPRLASSGNTQVLLSRVGLGVGVAAVGFAAYFRAAGDDPHRYEGLRAASIEGGAVVGLAGRL